ncbi:hypothetical protein ACHAXR_002818 [Thalassiosira sp. AJA248-18]
MSPPNIHLIPRGDDANDNDIIIENISTLDDTPLSLAATVAQEDDNNVIEEDFLSLSSATSATSIASTLSDGASRHHRHHHGRPRSASLNIAPSESSGGARQSTTNSTPRQRSTPRSLRPRSNPRTRTPMRNPSPLLITGSRLVVDDGGVSEVNAARINEASTAVINNVVVGNGDENPNSGNETIVRNIFNNTRRHRSRAGSIPEEAEEVVGTIGSTDSNENNIALNGPSSSNEQNIPRNNGTATIIANPAPRVAGHWLAQAATPTTSRNNNNHRSTNPTLTRNNNPIGLSDKQRPSHRKLRRWNNDRFIGTSSEHIHINLETEGGGGAAEQYWREFYMPNYPCDYRSEFAKLSTDETNIGRSVRERFVRGEVASRYHRGGDGKKKKKTKEEEEDGTAWMERTVVSKFHKLGISLAKSSCSGEATTAANNNSGVHDEIMGKKLFQSINNRIQSVVSRSCALGNNGESPSFATQVVTAFESYLVSLALAGSKKDIDPSVSMMGYPPQQPQCVYDLFDRILSSPPRVVIRNRKHKVVASSWNGSNVLQAVVVPAVHFYFPAEYDTNDSTSKDDGQAKPNSAFYRILLYAVCQFHGLESSSTIIVPNRNGKKKKKKRGSNKGGGDVKVVTVQGGVLLAPALKLLDCVSFSE